MYEVFNKQTQRLSLITSYNKPILLYKFPVFFYKFPSRNCLRFERRFLPVYKLHYRHHCHCSQFPVCPTPSPLDSIVLLAAGHTHTALWGAEQALQQAGCRASIWPVLPLRCRARGVRCIKYGPIDAVTPSRVIDVCNCLRKDPYKLAIPIRLIRP